MQCVVVLIKRNVKEGEKKKEWESIVQIRILKYFRCYSDRSDINYDIETRVLHVYTHAEWGVIIESSTTVHGNKKSSFVVTKRRIEEFCLPNWLYSFNDGLYDLKKKIKKKLSNFTLKKIPFILRWRIADFSIISSFFFSIIFESIYGISAKWLYYQSTLFNSIDTWQI